MMREAQSVGEALGIRFRIPIEKRIAGGEAVGTHKTSMLQDVEAGRAVEADALIGSVIELGRIIEVPTPHLDTAYALVKLLSKTLSDQHGPAARSPPTLTAFRLRPDEMNTMPRSSTLRQLMSAGADDAPAIAAPGTVAAELRRACARWSTRPSPRSTVLASAATIASRSCCRTGRTWRPPSSASRPARPRLR